MTTTPSRVRDIKDPMRRLTAAADLIAATEAKADEARALRDMATIIAHLDHGVQPVVLYRELLGRSRALFNRIKQRAPSDAVRRQIMEENPALAKDPMRVGKQAAKNVTRWEGIVSEVQGIRNDTMVALMNGESDDGTKVTPVSNADIARATGLTTARVAQIRKGL